MVSWLSTAGWAFFLGFCRGDARLARAVGEVVLQDVSLRDAAKLHRLSQTTLYRHSVRARATLGQMIERGDLIIDDLVVPGGREM